MVRWDVGEYWPQCKKTLDWQHCEGKSPVVSVEWQRFILVNACPSQGFVLNALLIFRKKTDYLGTGKSNVARYNKVFTILIMERLMIKEMQMIGHKER